MTEFQSWFREFFQYAVPIAAVGFSAAMGWFLGRIKRGA